MIHVADIDHDSAAVRAARMNLTAFVHSQARAMSYLSGIPWQGCSDAPSDFGSMAQAYARSRAFDLPFPVSDLYSDSSIYLDAKANVAFRYWHDLTHVRLGAGFDTVGEVKVALGHLAVLTAYGFGPDTIEYQLLQADTMGQTLYAAATGDFPPNQLCFARQTLRDGLPQAIRARSAEPS